MLKTRAAAARFAPSALLGRTRATPARRFALRARRRRNRLFDPACVLAMAHGRPQMDVLELSSLVRTSREHSLLNSKQQGPAATRKRRSAEPRPAPRPPRQEREDGREEETARKESDRALTRTSRRPRPRPRRRRSCALRTPSEASAPAAGSGAPARAARSRGPCSPGRPGTATRPRSRTASRRATKRASRRARRARAASRRP
mmetsp:Transcript_33477/g.101020  ORF Transcript_33477/g.101020 Transcript_33477/m.101020 type:complete len:203 (-) Transcript_33477:122-730(-)